MKRDQALSLLTKDKWIVPESMFEALVEVMETLQYEYLAFDETNIANHIPAGYREQTMQLLTEHGVPQIKMEICIRLLLKGYIEDQLFN